LDIYAIAQCTPGIIAINTATMIGYRRRGLVGAIVATLGQVTPSVVIITIIATILSQFQSLGWIVRAFDGIRIVVCALIAQAVIRLIRKSVVDPIGVVIVAITLILTLVLALSPIIIIVLASAGGILLSRQRRKS
jgi:chromate transporter